MLQWGEGLACQYPADSPTVSTFEALDALTQHFSNDRWFPSVSELVLAGHSMGGQLIHRYAVLGAATPSRPKDRPSVGISFVVANPSSFLYLTEERPCATKGSEVSSAGIRLSFFLLCSKCTNLTCPSPRSVRRDTIITSVGRQLGDPLVAF